MTKSFRSRLQSAYWSQSLQQPMRAWELQRRSRHHSGRMGPSLDIQARLAMRLAT